MTAIDPASDDANVPVVAEPSFSWSRLICALLFFTISLMFSAYTGFHEASWGYSTGFLLIGLLGALTIHSGAIASLESSVLKVKFFQRRVESIKNSAICQIQSEVHRALATTEELRKEAERLRGDLDTQSRQLEEFAEFIELQKTVLEAKADSRKAVERLGEIAETKSGVVSKTAMSEYVGISMKALHDAAEPLRPRFRNIPPDQCYVSDSSTDAELEDALNHPVPFVRVWCPMKNGQ